MQIKINLLKTGIMIFIVLVGITYISHFLNTPIIRFISSTNYCFLDHPTFLEEYSDSTCRSQPCLKCDRAFCFDIPFKVKTRQYLDVKVLKPNLDLYSIDLTAIYTSEKNIDSLRHGYIKTHSIQTANYYN